MKIITSQKGLKRWWADKTGQQRQDIVKRYVHGARFLGRLLSDLSIQEISALYNSEHPEQAVKEVDNSALDLEDDIYGRHPSPDNSKEGFTKGGEWKVEKNHIVDAELPGLIIASCNLFRGNWEANAARIVQCVNGWDELQKGIKYAERVAYETSKDNAKLKADNDALLDALMNFINDDKESGWGYNPDHIKQAQAIINRIDNK